MTSVVDSDVHLSPDQLREYETHGFLVLRDVFNADEMRELLAETERLLTERRDLISPNNLCCRYMAHHQTGEPLFEVFDPVNDVSPVCERFTTDARIVSAVESIYGEPACLFKEKLIFKPPGALGYKLHQDIPLAWKGFPRTFLSVLIPIDPSSEENGCTEVFSGFHADFLSNDATTYMLPDDAVDVARRTHLALDPGDVAIFHGLTPHRSAANRSNQMRRVLYVSYNALSDGGDQRDSHYAEFRERMREHLTPQATAPLFFRWFPTTVSECLHVTSLRSISLAHLRLGYRCIGRDGDGGHTPRPNSRSGDDHRAASDRLNSASRSTDIWIHQPVGHIDRGTVLPSLWLDA